MPYYRKYGKIQVPLSDSDFKEGMEKGRFIQPQHRAFCVLLYYSAVRKAEGLRSEREQFQLREDAIYFSVGKRLKHGLETPPLKIPVDAPYVNELLGIIKDTQEHKRVFPYSLKTGYNIVARAFKYPHLFRLSRITNFFLEGWTIAQVRSWTGLSLRALEFYVGLVDITKMGESLKK